jgi:hypothetical protein
MVNDILPIAATFVLGCIQLLVIITGSNMLLAHSTRRPRYAAS